MRICLLGWGSLYWDKVPVFDDTHGPWQLDGPRLKIEFSRVSKKTRLGALTLVIDPDNGAECQVAYADSKRDDPEDAICDLRNREGTVRNRIGFLFLDGSRDQGGDDATRTSIRTWAAEKQIDVAIWTDLPSDSKRKQARSSR